MRPENRERIGLEVLVERGAVEAWRIGAQIGPDLS
jgi:hypothetical protein